MQIQDFGVGFDVISAFSKSESSGLSGMRERANLLDGDLDIESRPGSGTSLTISLSLTPNH